MWCNDFWTGWKHATRETQNGWSGYDEGRRKIYNEMYLYHGTQMTYRGNTVLIEQCDGGLAGSNGYFRWIGVWPPDH